MSITIVSSLVENVCKQMNFSSDQRMQLAVYPDKIVNMAYEMSKGRKFNDKFHGWNFINAIVRKEFAKQSTSGSAYTGLGNDSSNTSVEEKKQIMDADLGIMPSIDLTIEENMNQWEIYEMSAQYWAQQSDFHRNILKNRKQKYISELQKHTPENLDRWRKKAKELRELYPYTKQGIQDLGKLFGIEPRSTTSNETPIEQPNTQEIKKDSTNSKFERIQPKVTRSRKEGYVIYDFGDSVEYKHEPNIYKTLPVIIEPQAETNSEQIAAFLRPRDVPDYNPFDEVEDLDDPLLL